MILHSPHAAELVCPELSPGSVMLSCGATRFQM